MRWDDSAGRSYTGYQQRRTGGDCDTTHWLNSSTTVRPLRVNLPNVYDRALSLLVMLGHSTELPLREFPDEPGSAEGDLFSVVDKKPLRLMLRVGSKLDRSGRTACSVERKACIP